MVKKNDTAETPTKDQDCVILLHGMGRSDWSMRSLQKALTKAGYHTVNYKYPSTSLRIEDIASQHIPLAITKCGDRQGSIHFVTHSLGGIVLRYFLQSQHLPPGSRVIMLCPPNKGSELADRFKNALWYQWLTGPAGQQLGTASDSMPNRLDNIDVEVGVITGRKSMEPWFSRLIHGEDDGKVSVERARLDEMQDFLVVDNAHTFIMNDQRVITQVMAFLQTGYFCKDLPDL